MNNKPNSEGRGLAQSRCAALSTLAVAALIATSACDSGGHAREGGDRRGGAELRVVATTSVVGDLVARIGGDRIRLTTLMGSGIDPHLYRASEGDVRTLSGADAIFYNGLHLEAKLGEVLERIEGRTRTFAVSDGIPRDALLSPPEFAGNYDPHIWFDVSLWRNATDHVLAALVTLSPSDSGYFHGNALRYREELDSLHSYISGRVAEIPAAIRVIVTAHDAFNYFGRAYGFEVRGLQGISTATEAGAADVRQLADFIAQRRIPALFVESSVPRRSIEAVQEAVRSRGFEVRIGGELFSDALGDADTPEGTYTGMMRHNIDAIVRALTSNGRPTP